MGAIADPPTSRIRPQQRLLPQIPALANSKSSRPVDWAALTCKTKARSGSRSLRPARNRPGFYRQRLLTAVVLVIVTIPVVITAVSTVAIIVVVAIPIVVVVAVTVVMIVAVAMAVGR